MRHLLTLVTCILAATATTLRAQPSFGHSSPLNDDWRFVLADDTAAAAPAYDDSRWQRIRLPHDWSITRPMSPDAGSCQGYLPGGIAWYRRHISVGTHDLDAGRRMYIYFEGVYNRSSVYLNGHLLGYRPSGFASFLYDLTPHLNAGGDNVLAVRVDHSRQNDSRWYTGSGIYRPVWLVSAPPTHFSLWGTSWRIRSLTQKKAVIDLTFSTTTPGSPSPTKTAAYTIVVEILDADGKIVATRRCPVTSPTGEVGGGAFTIPRPHLWTLTSPYLYKIRARLLADGRETDRTEEPLGLRTLDFSPDSGFALNGQWMKVKGVCLHDDAGTLGTAVPPEVWRRRLTTLKSLGVNAIRMSHNPHAPALYALCDTLGFLVMDEASDEWEFPKRKWLQGWNQGTPGFEGTYDYFEEWIDRDVADMVRRDRCHPSIFLWSIGNEVDYPNDPYSHPVLDRGGDDFTQPMYGGYKPGQPNAERIGTIAQRLAAIVRQIDPTRAVTGALAGVVMSNETAYPEAVDVVGYNYTESRYLEDHRRYPRRVIYGSENRHDLAAWKAVRDNSHIFGQFLWTGIDYLGESGPWPARGSEAGLLDLAGNVKPLGHYRAALWSETPVCYIGTYAAARPNNRRYRGRENREWVSPYATATWNYEPGQRVRVVCYTNADTARLMLCPEDADAADPANYRPIGGTPARDEATDILYWDIDYTPGTLRCQAANGATAEITTCGRPYALRAAADVTALAPGGIAQVAVEVIDEKGNPVPLADNDITCHIEGPARLLGLENGDIRDTSSQRDAHHRAHNGRLLAYVAYARPSAGANAEAAAPSPSATRTVHITFTSPLLRPATIELTHKP